MRKQSINRYATDVKSRTGRPSTGITVTPLKGFFITLLFLGVPTISLGTVCLSLVQNNLRLSQENEELEAIASEVKAEVDSLGEKIDTLKERAGVTDSSPQSTKAVETEDITSLAPGRWSDSIRRSPSTSAAEGITAGDEAIAPVYSGFLPQGGPSRTVDPVDLLKDVQRQVPELNQTLDASIEPALEETLAEEAAYPDGQPVVGIVEVSSEYGIRGNPFGGGGYEMHDGIDFVGEYGDIIAATGDGIVTLAGPNGGYGNTVTIDHSYGYETLYAHMSQVKVNVGDTVKRGQIIGYIGSTGRSSGPHLHYSLYKDEQSINPRTLLKLPETNLAQGPR
ncbi:MAG: M23 family metallopeptidase [Cyanobacteria bacterium P01_D01_bin.36]